jgi:hypothetical protein
MMRQYGRRQGDGPQHCGDEEVVMVILGRYTVALAYRLSSNEWEGGKTCREGVAIDGMYEKKERRDQVRTDCRQRSSRGV